MVGYPNLLYHPYVGSKGDVDSFGPLGSVQLLQMSTADGVGNTTLISHVKAANCLPYTNSLGTYDNNLAAGNFDGIDAMTTNGISIIQTNYTDILGPYLKKKGLR